MFLIQLQQCALQVYVSIMYYYVISKLNVHASPCVHIFLQLIELLTVRVYPKDRIYVHLHQKSPIHLAACIGAIHLLTRMI